MDSTVELAPAPAEQGQEPAEPEGFDVGPIGQLSFDVGGETPTVSTLALGGSVELAPGEVLRKGQRVTLEIEAVVSEVAFTDVTDAEGYVTDTKRKHRARVESLRIV